MTYDYENLGDDRFQQICQAILTTEFKDVQCLPVGQPDGGRDAFVRRAATAMRQNSVVFQVKFSKSPASKDERTVIEELIKTESQKIEKLKEYGLERYYLLTNVSGTSHLDAGSIDRVNAELSSVFGIPAYCWWRDDLDRRIDANSSIKWSYPEIIRGIDILQGLYEGRFGGEESRRLSAIKAYLAYQYKYDSQLKFKQVDLEKGLVDLFVDVPAMAIGPANPQEREKWRELFEGSATLSELIDSDRRRKQADEGDRIGAVRALVDPCVTAALPRVVIEGAPGQGKSTVTQFLCQLHRMLLLKKNSELGRVPNGLSPSEVRLPLRVDLRDYATWLSGRSPFQDVNTESTINGYAPALESFLAAQISMQSGGLQFSPDDLLAFASNSALLIVLDGFDEVADIATRNRLVREISDASTRFEGNSISSQFIVTSRPAAFANSPGFPRDDWQYIQMLPLTKSVISTYAEKWMSGHNMDARDRREITTVLEEKLEYPHVRELARNPMQLAILLALISTQGASLPDKRTTLYDRYTDIFFNRESEKSRVVRDKRELLIDMHRYLAWTLQVEAESDAKAGNISEQRLRQVLRTYLTELGHDPNLIDDLFVGMVERVVALVSRVQGTFEFEVQPLREYFAARYLYDTAPYIQAGALRSGSIMDRFDALARNAYWLNVTRFYCGCYSTGELPSLVDGLIAIGQSEQYLGTSYLAELSLTLLGDYVFSQQPRSVNRLADFLLEDNRFRLILAGIYEERRDVSVALPDGSGRDRLLEVAANAYKRARHLDTAYTSAALVKSNLASESAFEIWKDGQSDFPAEFALHFASFLDVIEMIPSPDLIDLVEAGGDKALRICVYRDREDVLDLQPKFLRQFFILSLDGHAFWLSVRRSSPEDFTTEQARASFVLILLGVISSLQENEEFRDGRTLLDYARRFGRLQDLSFAEANEDSPQGAESLLFEKEFLNFAQELATTEMSKTEKYAHTVGRFIDDLMSTFGQRALLVDCAIAALEWFRQGAEALPHRGVLAKLAAMQDRSRAPGWWSSELTAAIGGNDELLTAKAYLAWVGNEGLRESAGDFSRLLDALSSDSFHSLYASRTGRHTPYRSAPRETLEPHLDSGVAKCIGYRAAALLSAVVGPDDRDILFKEVLHDYLGDDENLKDARTNCAWYYAVRNPDFWPAALEIISDGYRRGVAVDRIYPGRDSSVLPSLEARKIALNPSDYPLTVVAAAQRTLAEKAGSRVIPVGSIAVRDQWFAEDR